MVVPFDSVDFTNPQPGVTRRIIARGGNMMLVHVTFEKGTVAPVHQHVHEQLSYIVSGSFEYTMGGQTYQLKAGDSYYVVPNEGHGIRALEDSVILDIFTPQREDFLR